MIEEELRKNGHDIPASDLEFSLDESSIIGQGFFK